VKEGAHLVEMGGIMVVDEPATMSILGLGSCLGIFLFEEKRKIGALAHAMLPRASGERMEECPGKYVRSAVAAMAARIEEAGGKREHIRARLAGGAHMFQFDSQKERSTIGDKNVEAAIEILEELGIELAGRDTGGQQGRSIFADTATGRMEVHTIRGGRRSV
jgi:chemotaxis protein CheD